MKKSLNIVKRNERGQALLLVLTLLGVGGIMLAPLLSFMGTGLKAGTVYETKAELLYAADAGVEDAIWEIRNDGVGLEHEVMVLCQDGSEHKLTLKGLPDGIKRTKADDGAIIGYIGEENPGYLYNDYYYNVLNINGVDNIEVYILYLGGLSYMVTADSGTNIQAFVSRTEGTNLLAFSGALVSSGDISLKKDATITGDIIAGGVFDCVGDLIFDYDNYDIYENVPPEDLINYFPSDPKIAEFALKYKNEALLGGTINGDYSITSSGDFGPKYIVGNLTTSKDLTINLQGTIYVTGNIDIGQDTIINGNGSIVAVGDIYLEKMPDYGQNSNAIIFSVNGSIYFRKEANLHALIYAPNGNVTFKKEAIISGSVVCGGQVDISDIDSDKGLTVTYDPVYSDTFELPGYEPGVPLIHNWNIS
jgi:acetyltransferase-like isoleucine patch superfamily enzyme